MHNCPSDIQLSLLIEGKFKDVDAQKIYKHSIECNKCSFILTRVLQLQDPANIEALPVVDDKEAIEAMLSIQKIIANKSHSLSSQAAITENKQQKNNYRLKTFLKSITVATGLFGTEKIFSNKVPLFAASEKNDDFENKGVRNDISNSSMLNEEHSGDKISDTERLKIMNSFDGHENISPAPTTFGTSAEHGTSLEIFQGYENTCAVRCQEIILRDFGINISQEDLAREGYENGWYDPQKGTPLDVVGNILENHNIAVNRFVNGNVFTLTSELAQGHKVIVDVNSSLLWNKGFLTDIEYRLGLIGADHALLVSGIDTSDPNHVKIIITDPGTGDIAKAYPVEQFVDAWKDSHCFMISTKEPVPENQPEMANFDYSLGHIPSIGNLPFDYFQQAFSACIELDISDDIFRDQIKYFQHVVDAGEISSLLTDSNHENLTYGNYDSAGHEFSFPPLDIFESDIHTDTDTDTDHNHQCHNIDLLHDKDEHEERDFTEHNHFGGSDHE
jgi:hypothetical protein